MRSSRSGTASTRQPRSASPRSSSPAARSATRRSSPPPKGTASPWYSPDAATSATDPLASALVGAAIIDGKAISAQVRGEVAERTQKLAARGVIPGLAAVLVGDDE